MDRLRFKRYLPCRRRGLLLLLCCAVASAQQKGNISEQYLFAAANQERVRHGLAPVQLDLSLAQAALYHAREMALRRTISHQFTGEPDLASRAGRTGVRFSLITENVAEASNSSLIHDLWMQSAGHRANLLDPEVDSIGIAVVADHGQLYAVEDFARTVKSIRIPDQEGMVGELLAESGLRILPDVADARQTCMLATGYAGSRRPWFVMRYTAADLSRLPDEVTVRVANGKYHEAAVGACVKPDQQPFTSYSLAILLYP